MNQLRSSGLIIFLLFTILPSAAFAEQFMVKTAVKAVSDYLLDVPCITLSDTPSATELYLESKEGDIPCHRPLRDRI